MKIESINSATFDVIVSFDRDEGLQIPIRLASLIMVAAECEVPSIACALPDALSPAVLAATEELVARNPIVTIEPAIARGADWIEPRRYTVARGDAFFCLGDVENDGAYSLFLVGGGDNVELASRFAHIVAVALGYTSDFSFEIRLSVYELLMNVVEHGIESSEHEWIQVDLEREGDMLVVSVIDQGVAFDPTGGADFDLQEYLDARKTRGLGLLMTRRIAEQLVHRRVSGYNRTLMKKSVWSRSSAPRDGKEHSMSQFEISGPAPLGNGSHGLTLGGDLDAKGALVMERMIGTLLEKKILRVTLDFEKVSFISSAGVGILLGLVSSLRDGGGDAVFTRVPPKVSAVFHLLNLEDYFTIGDSVTADR
jgi:anti-sigma B factor antagonist